MIATETRSATALAICAVVVTYNRKELLQECLTALVKQSLPVDFIILIDNASTDGTIEAVARNFPKENYPFLEVVRLEKNIGGAGGFHEGLKRGHALGAGWLWMLDDDTIPMPDALEKLLAARARFAASARPDLLASKVVWKNGAMHPMNIPWLKRRDEEENFQAAERATIPLRTATFVSLLLHRRFIDEFGLPLADYFLGGDDVEYTGRILKHNLGVAVPDSVVLHSTGSNDTALEGPPWKFYYYVRNTIWMLTRSSAIQGSEALGLSYRFFCSLATYLNRNRYRWRNVAAVARGLRDGILTAPRK